MLTLYSNIKRLRKLHGWSQDELAKKAGYIDRSSIAKIENGKFDLPQSKILLFAQIFDVEPGALMGIDGTSAKSVRIPVLGRVAAGIPMDAIEEIIDYEEIPEVMSRDGEYFGLKIKGDSMEPRIQNGDVVIVRKQSDADDGDLVIALVNGNEGMCKRLKKMQSGIMLLSNNPAYDPYVFSWDDINNLPVTIVGKVKELRGKF